MGTSNSCLTISFNNFHSLCRRSSISKLKHDYQEPNYNNAININHVSEDELLLLPGINRHLAQNIIQYRQNHNGFKQISELLQVNGITSNLLKHIYADITIDSFSSSLSNTKKELINLNLASYNELCSVDGLTPNLIKRIIQHRKRNGLFHSIEDLLKIKGIDYIILETIRPFVTVGDQQIRISISNPSLNNLYSILKRNDNNIKDTLSPVPHRLETLPIEIQTTFLSLPPSRPSAIDNNNNNNNNNNNMIQNTFRFASWNLQQLTNDKVQNPDIREVICRVILENNFSLIGIQGIENKESLDYIIQELNNPTIPSIKNWSNHRQGKWKSITSDVSVEILQRTEYLGFLYDESIGIELKQASLLPFKTYFTQLPYITIFRIFNKLELVFVNIHLKTKKSHEDKNQEKKDEVRSLSVLAQAMKNTIEQKHVIIFGDFDSIPTASEFEALIKCNYLYVIQQNTDISLKEPQGSICLDNIWLSEEAKSLSTGNSGIIRDGLTNIWIPNDWTLGGLVSDHCPIWMELDLS
ncbi:unnamed protein product [Rotaria sordida]|uniref:Endonuclease/exonuclease/phosphatase family domain-containing protein 1 n=1 Tax=Rotaria sordida TaxID=392033 RepID=A0A814VWE8_9BILA|nr:unnamed protein product [Rotaria sordida]CAF4033599.1 unnamed protein product [Rotaria sordida]